MYRFYCQHCRCDLGKYETSDVVVVCPDHPSGVVEVVEESDNAEVDS